LRAQCKARRLGLAGEIPLRTRAAPVEELAEVAVIVRRGRRVLLAQRPDAGRWAGLWEFPHGPARDGETATESVRRLLAELTGIRAEPGRQFTKLRHAIMRFRITLVCLEARYRSGRFQPQFYTHGRWVNLGELCNYPVSAPQRRLVRALLQPQ
jgi:A/G-specific adenine glycosylase